MDKFCYSGQQIDNMLQENALQTPISVYRVQPGSLSCVSEEDEAAWGGAPSPCSRCPGGDVAWHQSTV